MNLPGPPADVSIAPGAPGCRLFGGQRLRVFDFVENNTRELTALQQLAPLAAPAGDLILSGADRLFGSPARFDPHDVTVASRRQEAKNPVFIRRQLDENDPLPRARQVIDLVGAAQDGARLLGGRNDDFRSGHLRNANDLDALRGTRISSAGTRARLDERLETEPQAVAVAGDGKGVDRGNGVGLPRGDRSGYTWVEAERRDDTLAVAQLEQLLHWLAIAGGRRHVDDARRVGDAEVRKECDGGARAPRKHGQHAVALPQPRRRQIPHLLLPLHPSIARDNHDVVFFDDEVVGGEGDFLGRFDQRPALVAFAVLLLHLPDLVAHQLPPAVFVLEQPADLARAFALVGELVLDDEDLEAGEPIELQLEDGVGLLGVEREPLHDLLRGVSLAFRLADEADDLVERVED